MVSNTGFRPEHQWKKPLCVFCKKIDMTLTSTAILLTLHLFIQYLLSFPYSKIPLIANTESKLESL